MLCFSGSSDQVYKTTRVQSSVPRGQLLRIHPECTGGRPGSGMQDAKCTKIWLIECACVCWSVCFCVHTVRFSQTVWAPKYNVWHSEFQVAFKFFFGMCRIHWGVDKWYCILILWNLAERIYSVNKKAYTKLLPYFVQSEDKLGTFWLIACIS